MKVFVVFQEWEQLDGYDYHTHKQIVGVYSTEEKAVAAQDTHYQEFGYESKEEYLRAKIAHNEARRTAEREWEILRDEHRRKYKEIEAQKEELAKTLPKALLLVDVGDWQYVSNYYKESFMPSNVKENLTKYWEMFEHSYHFQEFEYPEFEELPSDQYIEEHSVV
jgi:hypothetical protein